MRNSVSLDDGQFPDDERYGADAPASAFYLSHRRLSHGRRRRGGRRSSRHTAAATTTVTALTPPVHSTHSLRTRNLVVIKGFVFLTFSFYREA